MNGCCIYGLIVQGPERCPFVWWGSSLPLFLVGHLMRLLIESFVTKICSVKVQDYLVSQMLNIINTGLRWDVNSDWSKRGKYLQRIEEYSKSVYKFFWFDCTFS